MKNKIVSVCDKTIEWCLYLLIFCLPFSKAGVSIFTVLGIIAWIIKRIAGFRADGLKGLIPASSLNKALAVFIIFNIISVVFSVDFSLSLESFFTKTIKFVMIFLMMVETMNTEKRFKRLLWTMILSAVLIAVDAGVQFFRGVDFLKGYGGQRVKASFSAPNGFSAWLNMFIYILVGAVIEGKQLVFSLWKRIGVTLLVGVLIIFFYLTFTRGAWIGMAVGLFCSGYYGVKKVALNKKVVGLIVLIVTVLVGAVLMISKFQYQEGIVHNRREILQERIMTVKSSAENRFRFWREAVSIIEDFPLFGSGLNTYSITAPHYKVAEGGGIYPHNSYLQMAAEIGLLGLVAFFWVLFSFFRMGFQYLRKKKDYLVLGLLAGILGFLVHAFFDTHLYSLQLVVLFWFMLGFATALIKVRLPNEID